MSEMMERMLAGELYMADDPEIIAASERAFDLTHRYNATAPGQAEERNRILRELIGQVGDEVIVCSPFHCDYGSNITIGARTYINFGCVMLDCARISIGAACQIASGVQFLTATHPIDPEPRRAGWEMARPISVADNVWLGGGVIVCPGVTIGADTVVGAGSVVVRDLPPGVVAYGSPARPQREIGEQDRVEPPER